jgi:cbb3-type cytochrome oxidase subunit 3
MQFDQERPRLGYRGGFGSRAQGFVVKALTVVGAGVVLAGAIAMSIVVFAIALVAMLVLGSYVWWKLRQLRRQIADRQASARFAQDDVIEGVVVREVKTQDYPGGGER